VLGVRVPPGLPILPETREASNSMFKRMVEFFQDVKLELKKVVFPTRKEVIGSTWVVIVSVVIAAAFLGMVDMSLGKLMTTIFKK